MIFGINTTGDISKLSQISRITILKYHSWHLCQISLQIMLLPILVIRVISNGNRTEWSQIRSVIIQVISNGNRTEWSPIRSVIIQVISNGNRTEWSSDRSVIIRVISNGNRTEWSPIRSVIIQVISNGNRAEWSPIRSVIIRDEKLTRSRDILKPAGLKKWRE